VAILVRIDARPKRAKSGDLTIAATAADGTAIRVLADSSSGLSAAALIKGESYALTGIAGQRATRKGTLDGYRIWLRDGRDVRRATDDSPASSPPGSSASPGAAAGGKPAVIAIARALLARSGPVTIEGVVTVNASLLDATGRRVVVEDGTAAIEILVPSGVAPPGTSTRISVTGTLARAYGAPRIRATDIRALRRAGAGPRVAARAAERDHPGGAQAR
jgi:hypothetical protein